MIQNNLVGLPRLQYISDYQDHPYQPRNSYNQFSSRDNLNLSQRNLPVSGSKFYLPGMLMSHFLNHLSRCFSTIIIFYDVWWKQNDIFCFISGRDYYDESLTRHQSVINNLETGAQLEPNDHIENNDGIYDHHSTDKYLQHNQDKNNHLENQRLYPKLSLLLYFWYSEIFVRCYDNASQGKDVNSLLQLSTLSSPAQRTHNNLEEDEMVQSSSSVTNPRVEMLKNTNIQVLLLPIVNLIIKFSFLGWQKKQTIITKTGRLTNSKQESSLQWGEWEYQTKKQGYKKIN